MDLESIKILFYLYLNKIHIYIYPIFFIHSSIKWIPPGLLSYLDYCGQCCNERRVSWLASCIQQYAQVFPFILIYFCYTGILYPSLLFSMTMVSVRICVCYLQYHLHFCDSLFSCFFNILCCCYCFCILVLCLVIVLIAPWIHFSHE